ncbi:MAG: beta-phosphoglucomutase [Clostridium sp.]|jgi:beta-phosphoglucomutase|nr:beta-phosphoglucomutase [Clostridium sp.]
MSLTYEAVIFDLDGVICHTDRYHYKAWKALADRLGIYFDPEINNRLRGVSRMESFEIILENCDRVMTAEEKLAYITEKNNRYKELLKEMSPEDLSEEVKRTLISLRKEGLKLAIGSSSKNAELILSRIGLGGFFDAVSDGNHISRSKPDPEVFLKAAESLRIPPEKCLVVEDAKAGLEAAIAAKMDCAAIGDAAESDLGTYRLGRFGQLIQICISPDGVPRA